MESGAHLIQPEYALPEYGARIEEIEYAIIFHAVLGLVDLLERPAQLFFNHAPIVVLIRQAAAYVVDARRAREQTLHNQLKAGT